MALRSPIAALLHVLLLLFSSFYVHAFQLQNSRGLSRPAVSVRSSHVAKSTSVYFPPSSQSCQSCGTIHVRGSLSALFSSSPDESGRPRNKPDGLIESTAYTLRRTSWFSWWTQVILTTISAVILLFARSVGLAAVGAASNSAAGVKNQASASFFIGGVGITISFASIFWTWGGARLSNRLLRGKTNRIQSANLLRRAITVASTLNLSGMLVTLMGTFVIIGGLATKVLTAGGLSPFGAVGAGGIAGGGAVALQTVQPLDILIVQANANTLLSHFVSLFVSLFLTRYVKKLDPPSTED
eukprot:CAMPEP_0197716626 /NCGR_PEP_ID=MMETSP1434-20131217/1450_1 /TAXON_ID=265543 /ORGANISM="Minutocellus polymorphus, Strain CCMP3303" /LENGTH=297 /DNA_ID=CAMNT_0043301015 /DNA_START=13 /DNA_END=906 /DNA_ORIENTATION=-